MDWRKRRKPVFVTGCGFFVFDAALYAIALYRAPYIDPTSAEFHVYFFGGISFPIVALVLGCFGTGWERPTVMFATIALGYLWISYIGIEIMKH
jgi:hypothetical protein